MKNLGLVALVIGLLGMVVVSGMDTSVATMGGGRVNNIGLIAEKQNNLLVFGVISVIGVILLVFGRKSSPEHAGGAGSASHDSNSLEKWNNLVKFDATTQEAIRKLEPFGSEAVTELRKAFLSVGNVVSISAIADRLVDEFKDKARVQAETKQGARRSIAKLSPQEQTEALGDAIYKNDIERVRELIEAGVDVNRLNEYGTSPLHMARSCNAHEIVNLLKQCGATERQGA